MSAMTQSILEEAQDIIHGARNASYGHPRDNFRNIALLWNAYLDGKDEITELDHAAMMVLVKVARLKHDGYHRDSVLDIAGYAGTMERLQEPVEIAITSEDYVVPLPPWIVFHESNPSLAPAPVGTIESGLIDIQSEKHDGIYNGGVVNTADPIDLDDQWVLRNTQYVLQRNVLPEGLEGQWQSENTGLIYTWVDDEWWLRTPGDEREDPWILSSWQPEVSACEGPFIEHKGELP